MTTVRQTEDPRLALVDMAVRVLKRIVAMGLLFLAITYWMKIVGMSADPGLRFDTMEPHWRSASVLMATLLPVAALGLWGQFTWGTTSWLIAAVSEALIYLAWPNLFGDNYTAVAFHLISIGAYIALKAVRLVIRKWHHPVREAAR